MSATIDVVYDTHAVYPAKALIKAWADAALKAKDMKGKIAIRVVDEPEMTQLNGQYRQKQKPTNILSFPNAMPPSLKKNVLGDLVICAPVLMAEAQQQQKELNAHWAHIVVHGILHLLDHDHEDDDEAHVMETLEIQILEKLGYPNPYKVQTE